MRPPVLASVYDAGLDKATELAEFTADWKALKDKYLAEFEAMKLENHTLRAKVRVTTLLCE